MKKIGIILILLLPLTALIAFLKGLFGIHASALNILIILLGFVSLPALILGIIFILVARQGNKSATMAQDVTPQPSPQPDRPAALPPQEK